jgi:phosphoglycolate phosphatase
MKNIKSIFFDLDGTLLNSLPDIDYGVKITLKKFNLPPVETNIVAKAMGRGVKNFVNDILSKVKEDNNLEESYIKSIHNDFTTFYKDYYYSNCVKYGNLYDGVLEGLTKLKENNFDMYVLTNKPHNIAIETIKKLNIENYFISVIGDGMYDEIKPSKEIWQYIKRDFSVNSESSIMVGDGIPDYEFAKNNNMKIIIALYGITERDELLKFNAQYYSENFTDIINIILENK